jgi:hypothetical protein
MAKASPGSIVSEVRGKISYTTFQHVKGRMIISTKRKPSSISSSNEVTVQSWLARSTRAFKTLSLGQRTGWEQLFMAMKTYSPGEMRSVATVQQFYTRAMFSRFLSGLDVTTTSGSYQSMPVQQSVVGVADSSANFIGCTYSDICPSGFRAFLYLSAPIEPHLSFINKSSTRFIGRFNTSSSLTINGRFIWESLHGDMSNWIGFQVLGKIYFAGNNLAIRSRNYSFRMSINP